MRHFLIHPTAVARPKRPPLPAVSFLAMPRREFRDWLTPLLCGLLLRTWMVHSFALVVGDSLVYGNIAVNWLRHGIYGLNDYSTGLLRPTLIRLPGYPMFLAV